MALFRYLVVGKSYVLKTDTAMYHAAWSTHATRWYLDDKNPHKEKLESGTVMLCLSSELIPDRRHNDRRVGNRPEKVREIIFRDATNGDIWIYYILDAECCKILPLIFQDPAKNGWLVNNNTDEVPTVKHHPLDKKKPS